jgi:D-alanyl-D-alanine carboxypeptidase
MVIASAPQASQDDPARGSAKTIRLVTSPSTSPRPKARPEPADPTTVAAAEAVVLSLQDTINNAVASAIAPTEEPLPFAVAGATDAPAAAPPPPAADPAADVTRSDQTLPFALVDGTDLAGAVEAPTETVAVIATPPRARPATLAVAATPEPAPGQDSTAPNQMAEAQPEALIEDPVITLAEGVAAQAEQDPAPEQIALLSAPAPTPLTGALPAIPGPPPVTALRPAPKPGAEMPVPEQVVITRLSTSGGRHWGITLGRFSSRAAAERALMRTALSDGAVVGDGLRKIAHGAKGFDANILGLTQDQADLACRRMQARAQTCLTLSP